MTSTGAGPLLREWRGRRRRSQMDLALEAGVSPKHLSFVETGRSRPSPELLLTLARHLEVPLRERNSLLLAAGYAPRYHETAIDDPASQHVRASLERLLRTHDPYPGVVLNRTWDIVLANDAALRMVAAVPAELMAPAAERVPVQSPPGRRGGVPPGRRRRSRRVRLVGHCSGATGLAVPGATRMLRAPSVDDIRACAGCRRGVPVRRCGGGRRR